MEGNEVSDDYKEAAENTRDAADLRYLQEASLFHLARKTADQFAIRVNSSRRYRPAGRQYPPEPQEGTEGVSRVILPGPFGTCRDRGLLGRQDKDSVKRVWWCGGGERQTRRQVPEPSALEDRSEGM